MAQTHGVFIPLDDYYDAITFREPSRPGYEIAPPRDQAILNRVRLFCVGAPRAVLQAAWQQKWQELFDPSKAR